jgi:hypothetical protein
MYNKEAIYRYKENHPDEFKIITQRAASKYRQKNIEAVREKDRERKRPFIMECKRLRNIDIF